MCDKEKGKVVVEEVKFDVNMFTDAQWRILIENVYDMGFWEQRPRDEDPYYNMENLQNIWNKASYNLVDIEEYEDNTVHVRDVKTMCIYILAIPVASNSYFEGSSSEVPHSGLRIEAGIRSINIDQRLNDNRSYVVKGLEENAIKEEDQEEDTEEEVARGVEYEDGEPIMVVRLQGGVGIPLAVQMGRLLELLDNDDDDDDDDNDYDDDVDADEMVVPKGEAPPLEDSDDDN